jgi:hypothetical protein
MSKTGTSSWDAAAYLDSDRAIAADVEAVLEDGNVSVTRLGLAQPRRRGCRPGPPLGRVHQAVPVGDRKADPSRRRHASFLALGDGRIRAFKVAERYEALTWRTVLYSL